MITIVLVGYVKQTVKKCLPPDTGKTSSAAFFPFCARNCLCRDAIIMQIILSEETVSFIMQVHHSTISCFLYLQFLS